MKTAITVSVVLLALVIIVPALFPTISLRPIDQQHALAKSHVVSLSQAISFYKSEYGEYPSGSPSEIISRLTGENLRGIVFFETYPERLQGGVPLDPWKRPFQILISDHASKPQVLSLGADGIDAGGKEGSDDITSWR